MSKKEESSGRGSRGIGVGAVLAIVLSWSANHSVGYAILHALCGWFYVLYYIFCK